MGDKSTSTPLTTGTHPSSPLSPLSPPLHSAKSHPRSSGAQPQTPTSPSSLSTPSQPHTSPNTSALPLQNSSMTSVDTLFSPQTGANMSAQTSQHPSQAAANAMPTPASSVAGVTLPNTQEHLEVEIPEIESVLGKRRRDNENDVEKEDDDKRQKIQFSPITQVIDFAANQPPSAMKSTDATSESAPRETIWLDGGLGQAWMREFRSPAYLLCSTPHPISEPNPSEDLISLYDLEPIALSVARTLPSGEKNKLRKTYKVKMAEFGLAGKHVESKHPEGTPGSLADIINWPEEEWQAQKTNGFRLDGQLSESLLAKMTKAMNMDPGPLPGFDSSILALDSPPTPPLPISTAARPAPPNSASMRAAGSTEPPRPKRIGTKRRYNDTSFEGYGEGFVDDDGIDHGYDNSDDEGRRGSGGKHKKRRKTESFGDSRPPGLGENRPMGMGVVGVGAYR